MNSKGHHHAEQATITLGSASKPLFLSFFTMISCDWHKSAKVNFSIFQWILFTSSSTISQDYLKLVHPRTTCTLNHHFYFNCIARLWKHLPMINPTLPATYSTCNPAKIKSHSWEHFISHCYPDLTCSFHLLIVSMLPLLKAVYFKFN